MHHFRTAQLITLIYGVDEALVRSLDTYLTFLLEDWNAQNEINKNTETREKKIVRMKLDTNENGTQKAKTNDKNDQTTYRYRVNEIRATDKKRRQYFTRILRHI